MIKRNQCAADVIVKLLPSYSPNSLSDKYLLQEEQLYMQDGNVYNDISGEYIFVSGCSGFNSGTVYLRDLELAYIPKKNIGYIPLGMYPDEGLKHIHASEYKDIEKFDIEEFDVKTFNGKDYSYYYGDFSRVSNIRYNPLLPQSDVVSLKKQFEYIYKIKN